MRMSDAITAYIMNMLESDANECIELKRNELAGEIGCVPSQINYVLSSRFTPEQGYIVESRRGGGGYIRIRRVQFQSGLSMIAHVVNSIGDSLMASSAQAILVSLREREVISNEAFRIIYAAVSDRALIDIPPSYRDKHRARLLKHLLTVILT